MTSKSVFASLQRFSVHSHLLILVILLTYGAAVHAQQSFTVTEGATFSGAAANGEAPFSLSEPPSLGTLVFNSDGTFTYTASRQPWADFIATDSFEYRSSELAEEDEPWIVVINITPVNDAPAALPKSFDVALGDTYNGQVEATDVDGDALTYAMVSEPDNGTLVLNANGSFSYTSNSLGDGTDAFTFIANDGLADSNIASVDIRIIEDPIFSDRFQLEPGNTFKDCPDCPTMVVIATGTFTQGSPEDEPQSNGNERPQRPVNVPAFAMGQTAVTFDEWDACVADGGCTHNPGDSGWGRGDRPVINVNWNDAQQYVTWLSSKTGHEYRLPSESEWEYATRAGTTGRFNTGDCVTTDQANFRGTNPATGCPTGIYRQQTLPVGSFAPNAFGLYDTHGNVFEWTQDCWNENYVGAPTNGSAWITGECSSAVLRGGSWFLDGSGLRSAFRGWVTRGVSDSSLGFRVARSLTLPDYASFSAIDNVGG